MAKLLNHHAARLLWQKLQDSQGEIDRLNRQLVMIRTDYQRDLFRLERCRFDLADAQQKLASLELGRSRQWEIVIEAEQQRDRIAAFTVSLIERLKEMLA